VTSTALKAPLFIDFSHIQCTGSLVGVVGALIDKLPAAPSSIAIGVWVIVLLNVGCERTVYKNVVELYPCPHPSVT
jgi:hypothetical protein